MTFENSQPPISNGSSHYGSRQFNLCPPGNLTYNPPDSYHHPTRQREINTSQVEVFGKIFHQQRGGGLETIKFVQ